MKTVLLGSVILSASLLTGCAFQPYQGGGLYSDITVPVDVRDNGVACEKSGESHATNILGLIGTGDASVATAKKAGGIKAVGTVDVHFTNVLGLYSETTTKVCGK